MPLELAAGVTGLPRGSEPELPRTLTGCSPTLRGRIRLGNFLRSRIDEREI